MQHEVIAQVIGTDKFKVGLWGTELPVDWGNKLARSALFGKMSPTAQNRVIAVEEPFRGTLTQTSVYPREIVKAALSLFQTKGFDAPYYWAAFTIQGEWR